ncbi:MAG TPA: acetyl-CoA C-acyltransferase [Xanthomonadaceae bacterium]|nr:acetyl-CoA C-acyltransferase [Xanthomonadaceae bacterium]
MTQVVIAGAKRTPIGSFQGQFTGIPATKLGSVAIEAALTQAGIEAKDVSEVFMGCVLPAGLGQAPARQAALGASIPASAGCTTINKVCGSGMKAIMLGHDLIRAGSAGIVVAGGMESMTNAPHLLPSGRSGIRYGSGQIIDHMAWDGLTNPYDQQAMGVFGEMCVDKYGFTRQEQDQFASESVQRALEAVAGAFSDEIAAVEVSDRRGNKTLVATDEEPARCDLGKIPSLRPAFSKEGTITAATSSKISDGAAAVVLLSDVDAKARGLTVLARVVAHSTHSQAPEWFTTAPVDAIGKVLAAAGWKAEDVDLFEVNEAFACVAMAPMRELGIDRARLNVHGGACALGHPIGATGARITVTLIHALKATGGRRGVAALCIGGGEATALAIELA